jgi:hypothetical protein
LRCYALQTHDCLFAAADYDRRLVLPSLPLQDAADRLALARRSMAARQGTREFVRGKIGGMPFTPGE